MALESVSFAEIKQEFDETLGYIRQDMRALGESDLHLNYTLALLICCACDSIAWHRDLRDYEVFVSLLADPFKPIGKSMFEGIRNGLAHRFRPDTVVIGDRRCRFTLSWKDATHLSVIEGEPDWLRLNNRALTVAIVQQIDQYEAELKHDNGEALRVDFRKKHTEGCLKRIDSGSPVANAWLAALGKL